MEINYHLLTIFWVQPNLNNKTTKQPPKNNRLKRLLLKASSIGHIALPGLIASKNLSRITWNCGEVKAIMGFKTWLTDLVGLGDNPKFILNLALGFHFL